MRISISWLIAAVLIAGCKKNSSDTPVPPEDPAQPLSASFKISSDDVGENQDITLTPAQVKPGYTYYWDFGMINNKHISTDKTAPVVSFGIHGYYPVSLTITDQNGNTASSQQYLTVYCSLIAGASHTSPFPQIK